MPNPAITRSACDGCRGKRVRCIRLQDSPGPCARCNSIGVRCVTGKTGRPGRPPKQRSIYCESASRSVGSTPKFSISPQVHHTSSARTKTHNGATNPPALPISSRLNSRKHNTYANSHSQAARDLDPAGSASRQYPPPETLPHGLEPEFWLAPDENGSFSPLLVDQNLPSRQSMLSLPDSLNSPTRFQGLLSAEPELNAMLQLDVDPTTTLEMMYLDPFLGCEENIIVPRSPTKSPSVENSLVKFREEMEQRIAAIDTYYSEDYSQIARRCQDEDAGSQVDNPGTSLLICSKDFISIIQRLTPTAHSSTQTNDELSTEFALLVLSSYLALMRLFDCLFHRIHKYLCKVPPESYRSLKVKSVLRIGGVSALQDMPLKAYAMGIIDAIQCQVQTIEQYMGIPREYCLSDKPIVSDTADTLGIFSRPDRTRLFWTVMAQEDLKSQRGSRSYVDSIRANIKDSMEFINN